MTNGRFSYVTVLFTVKAGRNACLAGQRRVRYFEW